MFNPSAARPVRITVAFVVASLTVLGLAAWAAMDASFDLTLWKARAAIGLEPIKSRGDPDLTQQLGIDDALRRIEWDKLGIRVIALYALLGMGLSALIFSCYSATRLSLPRYRVLCIVLIASWCVLYFILDDLQDWRVRRQISALLPKFEQAGESLHNQWPTQSGQIQPGIEFYVSSTKWANILIVRSRRQSYPFHEDIGRMITRDKAGVIRFDLNSAFHSCVEYHPNETLPTVHISRFGRTSPPITTVRLLKPNWYLVRYEAEKIID